MAAIKHRSTRPTSPGCAMRLIPGVVLGLLAGAALAEEPRLLSPDEHARWQAIGRVNQAGYRARSLCSGTLIAPDKVLTAAHCVDPARSDPVVFVAGWYRGEKAASRVASGVDVTGGFDAAAPITPGMIAQDWAVLTLETPMDDIAPIPFSRGRADRPVELIAYSGSRPHALSHRGPCRADPARDSVLVIACASEPGNSGGPVLQWDGGSWVVVGVVSATTVDNQTLAVSPVREVRELTR